MFTSDFEKGFFKKTKEMMYCLYNNDIYLKGTRDTEVQLMDTAYMIYNVYRCGEDTKVPGDLKCAEEAEVRKWL